MNCILNCIGYQLMDSRSAMRMQLYVLDSVYTKHNTEEVHATDDES